MCNFLLLTLSRSIFYVPGNEKFPGTKKESPGEAILKGEGMKKI